MDELAPIITSVSGTMPFRVVVVGAGGTGARLIPPLMQVLRRNDSVAIVDGDHVEDRNLARQNFRPRDVGENKAEVMARRNQRDGIAIDAFATMLEPGNWVDIVRGRGTTTQRVVIMGCVDNPEARMAMKSLNKQIESLWIDGGNERRGGQVIFSAFHWPFEVKAMVGDKLNKRSGSWNLDGMLAMPQLLMFQPWHCDRCDVDNKAGSKTCHKCKQPEASCRDRIDLQTVAVNQLSATCMLNVLSCMLYGVPQQTCGAFFSTLNTMSPIKLAKVNWDKAEIIPDTSYANIEVE